MRTVDEILRREFAGELKSYRDRRAAAFHEAGHVIAAKAFDVPVRNARIGDSGAGLAVVYSNGVPAPLALAITFADNLAELLGGFATVGDGDAIDQERAQALVDRYGLDNDTVAAVRCLTYHVLRRRCADIARVARALLMHQELTDEQIDEIINDHANP